MPAQQKITFNNLLLPTETSGVWFWRGLMQLQTCWSLGQAVSDINNNILYYLTLDKNLFQHLTMVMVQRFVDEQKTAYFNNFIVPMSEMFGFWKIYNIDDLTDSKHIPLYNKGRRAYVGKETQENLSNTLNNADFILTTTEYLKNAFHESYGIPLENFICIPNLLPRWWIGNYFNPEKKVESFRKNKNKPRIGITSSLSHYNPDGILKNKNDGTAIFKDKMPDGREVYHNEKGEEVNPADGEKVQTDLDTILPCILKTIDEVQWVFFGYLPPELEKFAKEKKIEVYAPIQIINYPMKLNALDLTAVVSPLISDSKFNNSKTNIKWLESCALGIPLFAPDTVTYSPYMPKRQIYTSSDDLYEKILKLKQMSATVYESTIMNQWKFINSPFIEGKNKLNNWWLEDNIKLWLKLFRLPSKCRTLSMKKFKEVRDRNIQEQMINTQIQQGMVPQDSSPMTALAGLSADEALKNSEIIFENGDLQVKF